MNKYLPHKKKHTVYVEVKGEDSLGINKIAKIFRVL